MPTKSKRPLKTAFDHLPWQIFFVLALLAALGWLGSRNYLIGPADIYPATPSSSTWTLQKESANHEIEGYASSTSVTPGSAIGLMISCHTKSFKAGVFRMGWYSGAGAKLTVQIDSQPCTPGNIPKPAYMTGLVNLNWPTSVRLHVPSSWQPGIYLVKLTDQNGYQNYVPFTVRSATAAHKFLFVHAVNTDNAYNEWGGDSLYSGYTAGLNVSRGVEASFNRPFWQYHSKNRDGSGDFLKWEYPMIKFLEQQGYGVDYVTDVDIQENPALLRNYTDIIIAGHNEYWSKQMWNGYKAAIDSGVNLSIFGGNTAYRPVRFMPDPNTGQPDRIMVNYKSAELDPYNARRDKSEVTPFSWGDPPLNRPESELLGIAYVAETGDRGSVSADLVVNDDSNWMFDGSGLKNGDSLPGLVGYEYEKFFPNLPHPPNVDLVFHSPLINQNNQPDYADGAYYSLKNGGQVFDAGTMQWSWGLDPTNKLYSPQLVKVTENILDRFGGVSR